MSKVNASDEQPRPEGDPPKRFWLFGGAQFYPSGGLEDFRQSFSSVNEAVDAATTKEFSSRRYPDMFDALDWWTVFDSQTCRIVTFDGKFFGGDPPTNIYLNECLSK